MRLRALGWCRHLRLALFGALQACASAHVIRSEHALNHEGALYLEQARGARPGVREGQLLIRYLRAGGVYFEWQGQALMTAPFASNYPLVEGGSRSRYRMQSRGQGGAAPFRWLLSQRVLPDQEARLIDTLRGSTSEEFLDAVQSSVRTGEPCSKPELREGMRAEAFSVPLPGEWLVFDTTLSNPRCR